jgi:hypothetical protein
LIKTIGDRLWSRSSNYLDYAKNCYDYAGKDMRYIFRYEFNTLSDILKKSRVLQTFVHINWIYSCKKDLDIKYEVTSKEINFN